MFNVCHAAGTIREEARPHLAETAHTPAVSAEWEAQGSLFFYRPLGPKEVRMVVNSILLLDMLIEFVAAQTGYPLLAKALLWVGAFTLVNQLWRLLGRLIGLPLLFALGSLAVASYFTITS